MVYVSSDVHALRRYVDDTRRTEWKMANGLRVWLVDRDSRRLIHLGGELTWGDCRCVAQAVEVLITSKVLPYGDDYGVGPNAVYVWLSDGMPWFHDHLLPLFEPESLVVVLDAYHVLERFGKLATALHRKAKSLRAKLYARLATLVAGIRNNKSQGFASRSPTRRGYNKGQCREPVVVAVYSAIWRSPRLRGDDDCEHPRGRSEEQVQARGGR
ncbi:MAG: hypothetical protein ACI81R_003356 [Bradymonadia bacterium]